MKLLEKRRRSKWENTGRWSSVRWWGTTRWWRHRRSVRLWASSRPWDFERSGRRRSTLWNCPFVSLVWLLLLCCSYCFPILTRLCFQARRQINNIPAPASNWRKSSLELLLQMTKPSSSSEKQTFHSSTDSAPKHLQILSKSQQGSCAMRGTISIKHSSHLSSSFCFQSIVPPSLLPHQENRQEDETP
jgi:hypothetical protein